MAGLSRDEVRRIAAHGVLAGLRYELDGVADEIGAGLDNSSLDGLPDIRKRLDAMIAFIDFASAPREDWQQEPGG